MSTQTASRIVAAAFLVMSTGTALPQPGGGGGGGQVNTCVCPTPEGCGTDSRVRYYTNVPLETLIEEPIVIGERGEWHSADACDCAFIASGDCERFSCTPGSWTSNVEESVCWTWSLSVAIEGETGLLASLLGQLGVTVTPSGEREHGEVYSSSRTWPVDRSQCFKGLAREVHAYKAIKAHLRALKNCEWRKFRYSAMLVYVWIEPCDEIEYPDNPCCGCVD